jgi:acylphosphatase
MSVSGSPPDPGSRCAHFVVRGYVQGVYFRAATQQTARALGLKGWVRNRPDGCVELVACGDAAQLDALEAWLAKGPREARVTGVSREHVRESAHADFLVRR